MIPVRWVYNRSDIDGSEVVWAREISSAARNELIQYFRGRRVWIVEADKQPAELIPFIVSEGSLADENSSLKNPF